jgi:hypothetical protein
MAIVLLPCYTAAVDERFRKPVQCVECPSSLLLVAQRMAATKMATITGTTKNGEVMCIAQAPYCSQSTKKGLHFRDTFVAGECPDSGVSIPSAAKYYSCTSLKNRRNAEARA